MFSWWILKLPHNIYGRPLVYQKYYYYDKRALLWHVYIKSEWQLIVREGQHGLIDMLYTYPCMTSRDVDVIDDVISPSSVRPLIICDVFQISRLWGHCF